MKNRTILILLAVALAAGVFHACKKEKIHQTTQENSESTYIVNNVLNFSQQASLLSEGSYLKNGEKVPIDTALFYISATLNYIYCDHTAQYRELLFDTIKLEIPIIGQEDKTFLVDALAGYNEVVSQAKTKYKKINNLNKKLINLSFLGSEINEGLNTINISLGLQVGVGNAPVISAFGVFDEEDQFWWTRDSWNCYNQYHELGGAPNVLEQHIIFKYITAPPPNCRYWFPFTFTQSFNALNYHAGGVDDYFCDYKIFYANGPSEVVLTNNIQCLGLDNNHPGINEMNFYLQGLDEIISGFLANTGQSVASLTIASPLTLEENNAIIEHQPYLSFGFKKTICWESPNNNYPISIE